MIPKNFISAICLVLSFILIAGILYPQFGEWQDLKHRIKNTLSQIKYKEEYFKNLAELSQKLEGFKENLLKIETALPEGPQLPALFHFLEKKASQTGLILKEVSTLSTKEDKISSLSLKVTLTGSYSNFKNFLSLLEKSSRWIEISEINFSSPGKGRIFIFNLTLKVYFY